MKNSCVSEQFGVLTFNRETMRKKLPKSVYRQLLNTLDNLKPLDLKLADVIAHAVKEWAIENGATHYCHWFQPLTGSSAEKHDSFLTFEEGVALERFSGQQLIQGEPDASSFPNGGIRSTFEARGYTAWDPSSPIFIMKSKKARILAIPSVFVSYHGQALDTKTPLLRSMRVLDKASLEVLELFGSKAKWVRPTLGAEQEYFLIRSDLFEKRLDLKLTNRSVLGAYSTKDQQLEDHYFGQVHHNVLDFMHDLDVALHELGVPSKTRHNEVAPAQFEVACIYEFANVACDHNQLLMQVIREVARSHGFEAIFHEKPFAGINGTGKHSNWSLEDSEGNNLLEPGNTPRTNLQFLVFLVAILQGVYRYEDLIRSSVATAGNDHRLGANEAPPAIMSVFVGHELNQILNEIESGTLGTDKSKSQIDLGVDLLLHLTKDNTDRNRTSPFAFTGNKFEFRAVGGEQSVAIPMTFLNTAIADSIFDLAVKIRSGLEGGKDFEAVVMSILSQTLKDCAPIRFEGNNYSQQWIEEAQRRGLSNYNKTPDALMVLKEKKNIDLLEKYRVLSAEELGARFSVQMEAYATKLEIEFSTLSRMITTQILPAGFQYQNQISASIAALATLKSSALVDESTILAQATYLKEISEILSRMVTENRALDQLISSAKDFHEEEKARFYSSNISAKAMDVRALSDRLEVLVSADLWKIPTYTEILHTR